MSIPDFLSARISDDLELAYIDSWHGTPVEDRPAHYSTWIGVHGVGFNSAVWTPLLPALPANVRFLAYNQRSYAQSSPAFDAKEPGGVDATARYLCDLMGFVRFAVEELGVPGVDEQTHEGGVMLMGWSKGTVPLLSLLSLLHTTSSPSPTSFLSHLPPSGLPHTALLTSHVRSLILFEPPGSAFGRAPTADYTSAMAAVSPPNSSTPDEFAEAFAGWIGSYSPGSPAADTLPPSGLAALSPALLQRAWQPECVPHGFSWRLAASASECASLARQALAPAAGGVALPVGFVYGTRTNGYCLDAAETVQGWWKESGGGKTAVRTVEGSNHFAFVHEPEAFVRAVEELVDELA
ncbi:hypothetical protein JCM10450v2_000830 [Rhodotorula kratochvilovae]